MTPTRSPRNRCISPIWLLLLFASSSGCTAVQIPDLPTTPFNTGTSHRFGGEFDPMMSVSEQTYHAVRQAQSENGVVLQVIGDETPVRVLPLPPENQSVYVSELLEQTGVARKLGSMDATLFRYSTDSLGGLPMNVKMTQDGGRPRPESDYALRAGDRLQVQKAASPALNGLFSAMLGL